MHIVAKARDGENEGRSRGGEEDAIYVSCLSAAMYQRNNNAAAHRSCRAGLPINPR